MDQKFHLSLSTHQNYIKKIYYGVVVLKNEYTMYSIFSFKFCILIINYVTNGKRHDGNYRVNNANCCVKKRASTCCFIVNNSTYDLIFSFCILFFLKTHLLTMYKSYAYHFINSANQSIIGCLLSSFYIFPKKLNPNGRVKVRLFLVF